MKENFMKINQDRLIKTFVNLVKIDSESGEEQEIINYLQSTMIDLGFNTEIDKTGNLICSNDSNPKLMLAAHVDTVNPGKGINPIINGNIIKTDGTTILASDDKANIAIILEIIQILKENDTHAPLNVVFTIGEEVGLIGSKGLDYEKIKAKIGLNLDGETGEIDIAEPSMMLFDIEITGKAAHSGMEPEKGINALKIAAEAISSLDLGRIDEETTVNIGTIQGGTARNIVPEKVTLKAEVRSRNEEEFNFQVSKITDAFEKTSKKYGGTIKIISEQTAYAYSVSEDDELVQVLKNCFNKNGVKPEVMKINATSDNSNFSGNKIKCVTTGGCGKDYHTTREYLEIDKFIMGASSILDATLELTK
jgi:tripeptide aminopeptidase